MLAPGLYRRCAESMAARPRAARERVLFGRCLLLPGSLSDGELDRDPAAPSDDQDGNHDYPYYDPIEETAPKEILPHSYNRLAASNLLCAPRESTVLE